MRVRDLGSANGTFLNERPIQQGVARIGDVVRAGQQKVAAEEALPGVEALS